MDRKISTEQERRTKEGLRILARDSPQLATDLAAEMMTRQEDESLHQFLMDYCDDHAAEQCRDRDPKPISDQTVKTIILAGTVMEPENAHRWLDILGDNPPSNLFPSGSFGSDYHSEQSRGRSGLRRGIIFGLLASVVHIDGWTGPGREDGKTLRLALPTLVPDLLLRACPSEGDIPEDLKKYVRGKSFHDEDEREQRCRDVLTLAKGLSKLLHFLDTHKIARRPEDIATEYEKCAITRLIADAPQHCDRDAFVSVGITYKIQEQSSWSTLTDNDRQKLISHEWDNELYDAYVNLKKWWIFLLNNRESSLIPSLAQDLFYGVIGSYKPIDLINLLEHDEQFVTRLQHARSRGQI